MRLASRCFHENRLLRARLFRARVIHRHRRTLFIERVCDRSSDGCVVKQMAGATVPGPSGLSLVVLGRLLRGHYCENTAAWRQGTHYAPTPKGRKTYELLARRSGASQRSTSSSSCMASLRRVAGYWSRSTSHSPFSRTIRQLALHTRSVPGSCQARSPAASTQTWRTPGRQQRQPAVVLTNCQPRLPNDPVRAHR